MNPTWQSPCGRVSLYLGDCLAVLPTLGKVDCVVTSPPYNTLPKTNTPSGLHGPKGGRGAWVAKASSGYADDMPEPDYQEWLRLVIDACIEACGGLVWVNHKVRYRDGAALHPARFLPYPIYSEVIWDRRGSMALNCKRYAPSHEVVLGFGRPLIWDDSQNTLLSVWQITPEIELCEHPCPYPIEIPSRLIKSSTTVGDTILDPFCGSGTTGIAAVKLGRQFIGIEIEPRYFEIAKQRIQDALGMEVTRNGVTQRRMFAPEAVAV